MERYHRSLINDFKNGWSYHQMVFDSSGKATDYIFLEVNEAFEKLTGLKANDIIGQRVTEIAPGIENNEPDLISHYGKVAQTGESSQLEIYFEPFNKYYSIYATSPVRGYFITTFDDVSAFRKKEKEYQAIIQLSFDGFWVCDLQGKVLQVNQAFCDMLGYREDELLSMSIPDFEVIENPEETARHIHKIIETGHDRFQTRHRRKDGRILDIMINASYLQEDNGKLFVFNSDITKEKHDELALRESEEKYKTLAETSPDHIFIIGEDLRVKYINKQAANSF